MLVAASIIVIGSSVTLWAAVEKDCEDCLQRDAEKTRAAYSGYAMVIVGCLLACMKFGGVL